MLLNRWLRWLRWLVGVIVTVGALSLSVASGDSQSLPSSSASAINNQAQTTQANATQSTRQSAVMSSVSGQNMGSAQLVGKKQLWNLQDADIRAVIQSIAELTGKNFIIDPRVQGKVTIISNTPMTKDESYHVFLSLLQILGYAAVPSGDVIKILPTFNAKQTGAPLATAQNPGQGDQVVVRLITVNNVSATDLVGILRPLMSDTSSVSAYTPSNALILAGYADNINKLVKIVENLDSNNTSQIQVIRLKHADAAKIVTILQSLQQAEIAKGRVSNVSYAADAGSNGVLISGSLSSINRAKKLIAKLDTDKGMSGNTKVVPLKYLQAKDLAATLQKVAEATEKAQGDANVSGNVSIQAEIASNTVLIRAPAAEVQSLVSIIKQLDVRPSQVLVQAIIARVDQSTLSHLGIIWGTEPSADQLKTALEGSGGSVTGSNGLPTGFQEGMGTIPGGSIGVILKALSSNTSSNVLSTPSIVVLNNKKATITSGEDRQVANREYATTNTGNDDSSGVPFQTFQTQKADLMLQVTPQISPDNTVRLAIEQKDDSFDSPAGSSNTRPAMDTTDIKTSVLVNSGDILVLGGLIKNDHQKQVQKVPILGDIPLLGHLFRYRDKSNERKSLMVFIKTIILNNKLQNHKVSMLHYQYMRQQQIQSEAQEGTLDKIQSVLPEAGVTPHVQLPRPFE